MGWLTSFFTPFTLNPALAAAGAGLVAAPILIHLINRMRFRRVKFAAMEFLLASQQKNRRRVLLEQIILLLLRVLIVAGLVLLLARLVLDSSALALIRAGARTHHVVLLDDSGSMRNRIGETTAFEEAKGIVRKLVAEAARESDSQQLTLILLSQARENAAFVTERPIDEALLNELDTKLENVAPTHQALDLELGLEAARQRLMPERSGARLLHVLSDFRRSDWLEQPALLANVGAIGKAGIAVNLVRVVGQESSNLAVTTAAGDVGTAAAGVPVRVKVGVTNFGTEVAENVSVGVTQDRRKLPLSERFARIEPGKEAFAEFDVAFEAPGRHSLRFELEPDAFAADDHRHEAIEVAASQPVLIIDGASGRDDGPELLADALAPAPGISGISPRIEPVDFLRRNPIDSFRAVYLVNVPSLPVDALRPLEEYVRRGGGLAWFLGDGVRPEFYNESLHKTRAEGPDDERATAAIGLFPAPLSAGKVSRSINPESQALDVSFAATGRFAAFAGELGRFWRGAHVSTFLPPAESWNRDDEERADGVTTVARLKGGEPVVLAHRFGEGRVLTVLTSAGQSWTNWPRQFVFVPFALETFKEIAAVRASTESLEAGAALSFRLPAAEYDSEIRIERPDGTSLPLRATPRVESPGQAVPMLHADYRDTDQPGIYKVSLAPATGEALEERWCAINAPLSESRLRLADAATLRNRLAGASNVTLRDPGDLGWLRVRETGREVRLILVVLLLALLVAEQALAYRLSYHPRATSRARLRPA